ncbi:MAG: hypothetical protein Q9168_003205 [Polycauliona sp. 1 TL-2023]
MASSTIPTTFLIISDTHDFTFPSPSYSPLQLPTPHADVLLHCGDLTTDGGIPFYEKAITMLGSIPAELKLVIAGNHDLELDQEYWGNRTAQLDVHEDGTPNDRFNPENHITALEIMTGPQAKETGITYLTEGTYTFTLSTGATFKIYVSPYTPLYGDGAFMYAHSQDRYDPPPEPTDGQSNESTAINPIPSDVDIIMTHGPPHGILDFAGSQNVGCPHLLTAVKRVRPMVHCFGHIHEGNGVEVVDWIAKAKEEVAAKEKEKKERKNDAVHRAFEAEWIENPYPGVYDWRGGMGRYRKGENTLAVNASVMDNRQRPSNAPWLVECDLKRAA